MPNPYVPPSPGSQAPYDDELEDLLADAVTAVTGIGRNSVRPRWQPEPPNQPDFGSDWAAVGVPVIDADRFPSVTQLDDDTALVEGDELVSVSLSFYGPRCQALAARMKYGLSLPQNREALFLSGVALVEVMEARQVPSLLKAVWVKRADLPLLLRRRAGATYQQNAIAASELTLDNEHYLTDINVTPPTP